MSGDVTATHKLAFKSGERTAKTIIETGTQPKQLTYVRIPRISKMMAIAIRLEQLIKSGQVTDQADLYRLGHVSRARLTQIIMLLQLPPDIQEALLFLRPLSKRDEPFVENKLRRIAAKHSWNHQRESWRLHSETNR